MDALIFIGIIAIILIWFFISDLQRKASAGEQAKIALANARSDLSDKRRMLEEQIIENKKHQARISKLSECAEKKDALYERIKEENNETLEYISSLMSDHLTLQYQISANYLVRKKHPARKEALRIRELRKETKTIIQRSKILEYRYEYLFRLFPDLELYVDDIESIRELSGLSNLDELEERVDRTRHYLSLDEYNSLSEIERNQLALDRYIQSQKSKWQIGRDYELFIGHEYASDGWNVDYFGIDKQLEDMGRDLVVTNGDTVHIVQCKYWAQGKLIHEKHIAQLYGTTVQFILSSFSKKKVVPVLATNISLSETAVSFAEYLDVKVIDKKQMTEFPRIKCNINRDESGLETKIYHLPMDQQYDRTRISKHGEFFASTIQEAVDAGFRRAWRWYGNG